jgi:phosphatidylglycerophosphatase A
MLDRLCKCIATFCFIGKLPAPGTFASAAATMFYWFMLSVFDTTLWLGSICSLALFLVGWVASSVHARNMKQADPSEIVIDEVAGQFLALSLLQIMLFCFTRKMSAVLCFICFFTFRILDITKPWPISWADEHVKGGLGIMLDDILAALITSLFIASTTYISGKLISFLVQ